MSGLRAGLKASPDSVGRRPGRTRLGWGIAAALLLLAAGVFVPLYWRQAGSANRTIHTLRQFDIRVAEPAEFLAALKDFAAANALEMNVQNPWPDHRLSVIELASRDILVSASNGEDPQRYYITLYEGASAVPSPQRVTEFDAKLTQLLGGIPRAAAAK